MLVLVCQRASTMCSYSCKNSRFCGYAYFCKHKNGAKSKQQASKIVKLRVCADCRFKDMFLPCLEISPRLLFESRHQRAVAHNPQTPTSCYLLHAVHNRSHPIDSLILLEQHMYLSGHSNHAPYAKTRSIFPFLFWRPFH